MTKHEILEPPTDHATEAAITYIVRSAQKPYVETAALTGGLPRFFATFEPRTMRIRNARPLAETLSLDTHGFVLRHDPVNIHDFYDDEEIRKHYDPAIEQLLRAATGARRVIIFDHTRRNETKAGTPGYREPAARVHNDYTEASARQRLVDLLGPAEAENLQDRRMVQVNVWRPIRGPVERLPLALLDATSLDADDLIATDQVYPDRVGEIYHVAYNPRHRWYYFPAMTPEEVILIKGYDSARDGRARFTPHTAFEDPSTPAGAAPRESLEVRTLLLF